MAGLTKVKGSGLATGAATDSLVGIADNATSTAITIDANENVAIGGDVSVGATSKLYLDGGSNTYFTEQSDGDIRVFINGSSMFDFIASGAGVSATKKLYVDGGGDTYISEVSANNMAITTGGTERMRIDAAGRVTMPYQPSASFTWSTHGFTGVFPATQITLNVGGHLASSGRFTAPIAGVYWVSGTWMNSTSGTSRVSVYKNGADMTHPGGVSYNEAAPYDRGQIMNTILLAANDYLELVASSSYSGIHQYHGNVVFRLLG